MSDKLNGIFDGGFSGIIFEGKRKSTMPNYLEQLAEREATLINPDIVTPIDLDFNFGMGLERAAELNNDESRIVESRKVKAKDFKKEIESAVEDLLSEGQEPNDIEKILNRKFPPVQVKRFFEANSSSILTKYSELVPSFIGFIPYKISREIDKSLQDHKGRLKTENSIKVCSSFYSYLKQVKSHLRKNDVEQKVAFKRDNDQKEMKERSIDNNKIKNERTANEASIEMMFKEAKSLIQSGLTKKEIFQKLAKKHSLKLVETFYSKYASEINKLEKFVNRENFDTDFKKITVNANNRALDDFESKIPEYQEKQMLNFAFKLMTQGVKIDEVKEAVKKSFNYKHAKIFLESNEKNLEKCHGQLGYVFIDSNIYANCDDMKKVHKEICHVGKQLMYSVKANKKCISCVDNACGTCNKVALMISNHPLVRSSRAAKRVLKKASLFVPKSYIDGFISKISENGNMKLISDFNLGIKTALDNERKNIGKKASIVDDSQNIRKGFEVTENVNVDFFNKSNKSSIIDNILNEIKK